MHDAHYVEKMRSRAPVQANAAPLHATQTTQELAAHCEVPFHLPIFHIHNDVLIEFRKKVFEDTYMSHCSWEAALRAAGAVLEAVDLVSKGLNRNAFCAIRPPGTQV